jgi:hypothetical protein
MSYLELSLGHSMAWRAISRVAEYNYGLHRSSLISTIRSRGLVKVTLQLTFVVPQPLPRTGHVLPKILSLLSISWARYLPIDEKRLALHVLVDGGQELNPPISHQ